MANKIEKNGSSLITSVIELLCHIKAAAFQGQTLPILTILLFLHLFFHATFVVVVVSSSSSSSSFLLKHLSLFLLLANALTNIIGYALLYVLTRHSIETIFNRNIPDNIIPAFGAHLRLLRPLEILWRYSTARWRVLPDVVVLGEVRCGTTSFCHHLSQMEGCHPPFCLWKHPELDNKETFYFVGHYLNHVSPETYRMCFPLKLTKWFHTTILRRPFFTFDGCAQYLTSPTTPYLLSRAYQQQQQQGEKTTNTKKKKKKGGGPPIMIACVRNPVDQTRSWWNYENSAMEWGKSMGLETWNTALRSPSYPPKSLIEALRHSSSTYTNNLYTAAERLVTTASSSSSSSSKQQQHNNITTTTRLPGWAITWPGGQLTGVGRNGAYASNIKRYERVFGDVFGRKRKDKKYVQVVPLEFQMNDEKLNVIFATIGKMLSEKTNSSSSSAAAASSSPIRHTKKLKSILRNKGGYSMTTGNKNLSEEEEEMKIMMNDFFNDEIEALENMYDLDLYAWKRRTSSSSSDDTTTTIEEKKNC